MIVQVLKNTQKISSTTSIYLIKTKRITQADFIVWVFVLL